MSRSFVHLHCHSHYSLLDGANRIPELVARTKEQGMNALALTDHGNLYGAIEFYRECKEVGINPIIGYEAYVAPGQRTDREARRRGEAGFHLTLLAQNAQGFKNLVKMASVAFLEGYHYVPRIDKQLLEQYREGIICLSGCASGEFSEFILKDQTDEALELARWFARVFGNNFYVEIQNNGLDIQRRCAEGAVDIANRLGLPLVATCDAHYLCQGDAQAHDVLLCINTGKTLKDENRMRYGSDQFYVRGPDEMYRLFAGREEAVERSQEIADSCDIQLDFKTRHFPAFTPPDRKKPETYLRELCEQGLAERYRNAPAERHETARKRLEHELGIICRMGFAGYFLIVWDFVRYAQGRGIPASARGSACGALVSYVLKLSDVDPLEYDLLFERFLDPNRSEAPDIDIDFCQERRDEVIAYVRQKYGEQSVAQIVTFGTLAAKAAIRDVGRVLDIPLDRVNRLTNMVPKVLNITLDEALQQSPDLKREYTSDPQIRELIDIARKLEGTNRQAGTHAAGVVIANGDLTDYVPLHKVLRKGYEGGNRNAESVVTTQWVMGDLEKVGLLKMDFLGLRTLTVMENTVKQVVRTQGIQLDLQTLPLDDRKTFELLQRGDAKGVFQLESDGIRELLKRMKPDHIRDLIACNALYRPGPLGGGMVDAYVNRKHGREKPVYPHAIMEEILSETYGVMCYQEQVMRILNRLGGIELSSAYACIKAISKKKHEIIDQRRLEFIQGAQERGVDEATAREIFELITFFGGYGFNKSHSAAYARIGYQTAYLKAHYPAEFMAALLSSEIEDSNKRDIMVQHIEDARKLGVEVLPPDVQAGDVEFTVEQGRILFGLVALKGLGRGAAAEIVRARRDRGPFRDLFDFCERVDLKIITRPALETLIKAGAFDRCGRANRAQLWEALPRALAAAGTVQEDRRHGQGNLFDDAGSSTPAAAAGTAASEGFRDIPEWQANEKLKHEKEALGFYISSHPLAQHEEELRRFSTHSVSQLADLGPNQEVFIGGMLTQVRFMNTKKARNGNSRYVRCKIEDFTGSAECVMWPDDFVRFKDLVEEDKICFVAGAVERNRDEPGLVLSRVVTLEQGKRERTAGLVLVMRLGEHDPNQLNAVAGVLKRAPGSVPVFLHVQDAAGKWLKLKSSDEFRINPATLVQAELETILGPGRVQFARQVNGNGRNGH
jgi:DNA polymerase-3 subunit alpha